MNKLFKKIAMLAFGAVMAIGVGVGLVSNTEATAVHATPTGSVVATFELGADGDASHNDGSGQSTYSESNGGYTLNITSGTKMYTGARDATGKSCIKLGTGSAAGGFSFTVPNDITGVEILAAKYKTNGSKLKVNDNTYTLNGASNSGAYDTIEVNTSSSKTITVTTVSGGYRAMVNTIKFYKAASEPDIEALNITADNYTNTYTTNDQWSKTGLTAVVTYVGGDTKDVTSNVEWNFVPATPSEYYLNDAETLQISATYNEVTSVETLELDVVVTAEKGCKENPYTVSEAYAVAEELAVGANNGKEVFVRGVVKVDDNYKQASHGASFTITDGEKSLLAYNINGTSVTPGATGYVGNGYTVVIGGAIKNYNGTLEICYVEDVANASCFSIEEPVFGTVQTITVETLPNTTFEVGQTFSTLGLVIEATDEFGITLLISEGFVTDFDGVTFTSDLIGTHEVTVTFEGKTTTYEIEVTATTLYAPVTSTKDFNNGAEAILVTTYGGKTYTVGAYDTSNKRYKSNITNADGEYYIATAGTTKFTLEFVGDKIAIKEGSNYIGLDAAANKVHKNTSHNSGNYLWTLNSDGSIGFNDGTDDRLLAFNSNKSNPDNPIVALYKKSTLTGTSAADYAIFKLFVSTDGLFDDTAVTAFAQSLLDLTGTICGDGNLNDNATQLEGAWATVAEAWEALEAEDQAVFTSATASETGSVVEQAAARYDYVVGKYSSLSDFASRNPSKVGSTRFFLSENTVDYTALIIVATVAILGVSALIIIKRRRSISE